MGVLSPVSAHAGHSAQPPIDTSGNFPARVSAESPSNISPSTSKVISEVSEKSFQDIFEISRFSGQIGLIFFFLGGGGSPNFFPNWNLPTYVTWKPMQKFGTL